MNWLNPINWIKSSVASYIDKKIDEALTSKNCKAMLVDGVNYAVSMSEKKWNDDQCRTTARGMRLAAKSLDDLAESIDPDGTEGRRISVEEFNLLLGDAQAAFGSVVTEDWLADKRGLLKGAVRKRLGL